MKRIKQLIWPLIMSLYGMAIFILLHTNKLKTYLHPKMHILSILAMLMLLVLTYTTAENNLKKNLNPRFRRSYVLFLLPLILLTIQRDVSASTLVAAENGLRISAIRSQGGGQVKKLTSEELFAQQAAAIVNSDDNQLGIETGVHKTLETVKSQVSIQEEAIIGEDGNLYLTDKNFTYAIEDLHVNLDQYIGRHINYVGLVYRHKDFSPVELVVGRLLMYCCAADAQIIGMLSTVDNASDFRDGDWVEITGLIEKQEYTDPYSEQVETIPHIKVEEINLVEDIEDPYVYFND